MWLPSLLLKTLPEIRGYRLNEGQLELTGDDGTVLMRLVPL